MTGIKRIIKNIEEKSAYVTLPKDAVAHAYTVNVPAITSDKTIANARTLLFQKAHSFRSLNYIHILTKHGKLAGILSIHEVFSIDPQKILKDVMTTEILSVHPHTDREVAAQLAVKHTLKGIPVTDSDGYFLGAVTSDEIMHILSQESEEDLLKLSGIILGKIHKDEETALPILVSFKHRVPWILAGLIGGVFTAQVISKFEPILEKNIILAAFIPLIAYVANAVGTQTQTLYIRDLSTKSVGHFGKYLFKQLDTTALIALASGLTVLGLISSVWKQAYIGSVVGLAIFFAIETATFFALIIPYILQKRNVDPAIGSGPFSTIIQDLLSIIIYFITASFLL